ncbi:MAG TPA: hypothetical protein VHM89_09695 [Acidimicrobiales bacterium]|nr:hypothetical protein [Acidimicrobiales bacterium]
MDDQQPTSPDNLRFTEEMKGFITLGETDHHKGFREGKRHKRFAMFHLTIVVTDVERFVADRAHEASATGWVEAEALGGRMAVEKGIFNLFVDTDDPALTRMKYRLYFADPAGRPLTLSGFKDVKDDPGFDVWTDTSTLYTHILRGHVDAEGEDTAEVVAAGILTIYLVDFMKQLTTFRVDGDHRSRALNDFGGLFLGKLWELYKGPAVAAAGAGG